MNKFILIFTAAYLIFCLFVQRSVRLFFVTTESMKPVVPGYSLIATTPQTEYEPGDIITYKTSGGYTTHRVIKVESSQVTNQKKYITKGDNNSVSDLNSPLYNEIEGKVVFVLSLAGLRKYVVVLVYIALGIMTGKFIKRTCTIREDF